MVKKQLFKLITKYKCTNANVTINSNLYTDLGLDSFAFVAFLIETESMLNITFNLDEMENCLVVKNLIQICNEKLKENPCN